MVNVRDIENGNVRTRELFRRGLERDDLSPNWKGIPKRVEK